LPSKTTGSAILKQQPLSDEGQMSQFVSIHIIFFVTGLVWPSSRVKMTRQVRGIGIKINDSNQSI
jgi:hypothetical protein